VWMSGESSCDDCVFQGEGMEKGLTQLEFHTPLLPIVSGIFAGVAKCMSFRMLPFEKN
jgi:hypothetical protein